MTKSLFVVMLLLGLAACAKKPLPPVEPPPPVVAPAPSPAPPPVVAEPPLKVEALAPVSWAEVDGWELDSPAEALATFRKSCSAVAKREQWRQVCAAAELLPAADEQAARRFFEEQFQPHQVRNEDGSTAGMITGYYGPEIPGSRVRTERFKHPIYAQPDDLLIVALEEIYPELGNYRLRGRLVGNRVVPYFERGKIDNGETPLAGHEIFWVEDPVELFFLHIQGSGRILLPDGQQVMVGYANQNGHRYKSIGKLLLDRGAMSRDQMSMQNIRKWVKENPAAGQQLLAENPSYVFFRELPAEILSPPGALGVPLTAERSIAVDPRTIPLGAPVFLATTHPANGAPLKRLMVAQDTGGAIKGQVRADFFWGMGDAAGQQAGRMKQQGRLWVLLPKSPSAENAQPGG